MDTKLLETMLIKQGVMLGGLSPTQRDAALAVVWAGLPDGVLTEKQVNEALRQRLAAAAAFLDTDHVELRRRLVDLGWLTRDGFGREYRRVAMADLKDALRPWADRASGGDIDAWAAQLKRADAARREQRRQAWRDAPKAAAPAA